MEQILINLDSAVPAEKKFFVAEFRTLDKLRRKVEVVRRRKLKKVIT